MLKCPQCGSFNLKSGNSSDIFDQNKKMECRDCGNVINPQISIGKFLWGLASFVLVFLFFVWPSFPAFKISGDNILAFVDLIIGVLGITPFAWIFFKRFKSKKQKDRVENGEPESPSVNLKRIMSDKERATLDAILKTCGWNHKYGVLFSPTQSYYVSNSHTWPMSWLC